MIPLTGPVRVSRLKMIQKKKEQRKKANAAGKKGSEPGADLISPAALLHSRNLTRALSVPSTEEFHQEEQAADLTNTARDPDLLFAD